MAQSNSDPRTDENIYIVLPTSFIDKNGRTKQFTDLKVGLVLNLNCVAIIKIKYNNSFK